MLCVGLRMGNIKKICSNDINNDISDHIEKKYSFISAFRQ